MILEEETYEKFGYHPRDFKQKSCKRILVICDECGKIRETQKNRCHLPCRSCAHKGKHPFLGKRHSKETRQKLSKINKGKCLSEETKKKISEAHRGKHLSKETRRKLSESHKGEKAYWFGKHLLEETKKKISKARKGNHLSEEIRKKISKANKGRRLSEEHKKKLGKIQKGKHFSKEHKRKLSKARQHQSFPKHHTKPERIFEQICKKYNLPFKYTGDGTFWIHNINPDFIECNGKKIAVEIFGDYWHSPLLNYKLQKDRTLLYRKKILKKYGWKLIVFWETDLKRKDVESFILSQLKRN